MLADKGSEYKGCAFIGGIFRPRRYQTHFCPIYSTAFDHPRLELHGAMRVRKTPSVKQLSKAMTVQHAAHCEWQIANSPRRKLLLRQVHNCAARLYVTINGMHCIRCINYIITLLKSG